MTGELTKIQHIKGAIRVLFRILPRADQDDMINSLSRDIGAPGYQHFPKMGLQAKSFVRSLPKTGTFTASQLIRQTETELSRKQVYATLHYLVQRQALFRISRGTYSLEEPSHG
jgi:hypothetical protein